MYSKAKMTGVAALALLLAIPAFADDDSDSRYTPKSKNSDSARVRVVHASPDAGPVDVLVNGVDFIPGLEFGTATPYEKVPAGRYDVEVVPAGESSPVVIDLTGADIASFFFNTDYTVVATGSLDDNDIQPLLLADDNSPVDPRSARIRFVHASPDAPPVDIALEDGPFLFRNIAFREVGDYVTVPAGTVNVQVFVSGTTDQPIPTIEGLRLMRGTTYTVFAIGFATGGSPALSVLPTVDSGRFISRFSRKYSPGW